MCGFWDNGLVLIAAVNYGLRGRKPSMRNLWLPRLHQSIYYQHHNKYWDCKQVFTQGNMMSIVKHQTLGDLDLTSFQQLNVLCAPNNVSYLINRHIRGTEAAAH